MKKLIFIFTVLMSIISYSQNLEFMSKIRSLDETGVIELATEIADSSRGEFELINNKETSKGYKVIFKRKGIDDSINEDNINDHPDDFIVVLYDKFFEGQNKALEVEGIKKYSFNSVTFNYMDLFPFWKKYFSSEASIEETPENLLLRESRYKKNDIHWLYKFNPLEYGSKRWRLNKFY